MVCQHEKKRKKKKEREREKEVRGLVVQVRKDVQVKIMSPSSSDYWSSDHYAMNPIIYLGVHTYKCVLVYECACVPSADEETERHTK